MTLNVLTEIRSYLTNTPIILRLKAALLQVCVHYANSHTFCCSKQRGELFPYFKILTSYFGTLFQSSNQLMRLLPWQQKFCSFTRSQHWYIMCTCFALFFVGLREECIVSLYISFFFCYIVCSIETTK